MDDARRAMKFDYYAMMPKWAKDNAPKGGSYNYAYYFIRPWALIGDWYRQCKWFIQRGYRGYADCDVWSIDWYLAGWLPKALRRLQANRLGHPIGMTLKGWQRRLGDMADGFDAAHEIQDRRHKYKSVEDRRAWRRFNRGMKLFHEHFFSLWD
jgi:hypothetical protein